MDCRLVYDGPLKANRGAKDYELFVQKVYQDLLKDDGIVVYHRKECVRRSSGLPIKIDVSFKQSRGSRYLDPDACGV